MRIVVIGAGISGLAAGGRTWRDRDFQLLLARPRTAAPDLVPQV